MKTNKKMHIKGEKTEVAWAPLKIVVKFIVALIIFEGFATIICSIPNTDSPHEVRAPVLRSSSMNEAVSIMERNQVLGQASALQAEVDFLLAEINLAKGPEELETLFRRKDSLVDELALYMTTVDHYPPNDLAPLAAGLRNNEQQNVPLTLEYYHPSELVDEEAINLNLIRWYTPDNIDPDCFPVEDEDMETEMPADLWQKRESIEKLLFVTYSRYDRYNVYFYTIDGGFKARNSLNGFSSTSMPRTYSEQCFFDFQFRDSGSNEQQFTGTISLPLKNIRVNQSFDSNGNPFIQPILEWFELDASGKRVMKKLYLPKSSMSRARLEAFLAAWQNAQECCILSGK